MEKTPNPKCTRCRCYWIPDETDIKSSGLVCKCCKKCREYEKKYTKNNEDKIKKYREDNKNKIKKYYEDNKEKVKKYYQDNVEKILEYKKKYREDNKCEHNKLYGTCKICNIQLYLIQLQRSQLRNCLKNTNIKKTKPSISYLNCSVEYFVEYFEKKMDIWNETNEVKMNWGNIHIDHIKPVNAFNLDDENEFLDCCHYTNMQPLLAKDNLSKSCKWTDENDLYWCNNIINKEYFDIYIC